ncbi:MAG: hypothetical protein WAZ48_03265, partial [Lysobacteraceae bacterium]
LVSVTATAADRESPGRYLIVAKPVSVQFVRYGDDPGAVVSPSFYKLKIKDARVVQGPSKLMPATMTLEIRANNGDAILDYDQVYLLLDALGSSKYKVVYWERVISMACMKEALVDPKYQDRYFDEKIGGLKMKCTYLRQYMPPE